MKKELASRGWENERSAQATVKPNGMAKWCSRKVKVNSQGIFNDFFHFFFGSKETKASHEVKKKGQGFRRHLHVTTKKKSDRRTP